jgi:hypothetical protein
MPYHDHGAGPLDDVQVASPCTADWDKMVGDDRKRFCESCGESVYNVSALTRQEAEGLVGRTDGVCIRFFRRTDGTVMTTDCPVGKRRVRLKQIATVVGSGVLVGAAATLLLREAHASELRGIYTVELMTQDHHHSLAYGSRPDLHVSGSTPVVPPRATLPPPAPKGPAQPAEPPHVMGRMAPPSRALHSGQHRSCDTPNANVTL